MSRRNSKECEFLRIVVWKISEIFKKNIQVKLLFFKKGAGYLTLTGNVPLGNFQNSFHKKHPQMLASAISCLWRMFWPKYIFQKISHSIFLIYVLIFYGICFQGLKEKSGFKIIFLKLVYFHSSSPIKHFCENSLLF